MALFAPFGEQQQEYNLKHLKRQLQQQEYQTSALFTLGSYNTFGTDVLPDPGPGGNQEPSRQILEIAKSGFDVVCLQELFLPQTAVTYQTKLREAYPYSFSQADLYDFDDFPRAPCTAQQVDTILSCSICSVTSAFTAKPELLGGCMAIFCKPQMYELMYTECLYCMGMCSKFDGCSTESYQATTAYCSQLQQQPIDLISGVAVFSKYPIVNQWHIEIPSWISKRAVVLAQIDISEFTDPSDINTDTIIVGCVHLHECDHKYSFLNFMPATQEQADLGISSHVELNAYQIHYILDNIFAADAAPWLNDGESASDNYNVIQLFLAGDFNMGEVVHPENLQILTDNEWINARDIGGMDPEHVDDGGTLNQDPHSDLPNVLAYRSAVDRNFLTIDEDSDHIFVYDGDSFCGNGLDGMRAVSFKREFTETYNVNGQRLPLSDHWGISFKFEFVHSPYTENNNDAVVLTNTQFLVLAVLISHIIILFVIEVGLICYRMMRKNANGSTKGKKYDYQFVEDNKNKI